MPRILTILILGILGLLQPLYGMVAPGDAMLRDVAAYSIVSDQLGTPTAAYDAEGNLVATIPHGVAAAICEGKPRKGFFRWLAETPEDIKTEKAAELQWRPGMTVYEWGGDGSLKSVRTPSGDIVRFEYDALGRRTAKIREANGTLTRFLWDGNVPLHEWTYPSALRPETTEDKSGVRSFVTPEPRDGMVTWVFAPGTFAPAAKIAGGRAYSIVTDYLGTPIEAYDSEGGRVWARELDIYGRTLRQEGDPGFMPFLYPGQYLDCETGYAYNRFRYYDPSTGNYISSDPIGLAGNNPTLYGYVDDVNLWFDPWGLDLHHIIPQQIYREFKDHFKSIPGYVQNVTKKAKDMSNLIDIGPVIHGNHPQYNRYVRQRVSELINKNNLNLEQVRQLQRDLTSCIEDAIAKIKRLNNYFKDGDHLNSTNRMH